MTDLLKYGVDNIDNWVDRTTKDFFFRGDPLMCVASMMSDVQMLMSLEEHSIAAQDLNRAVVMLVHLKNTTRMALKDAVHEAHQSVVDLEAGKYEETRQRLNAVKRILFGEKGLRL